MFSILIASLFQCFQPTHASWCLANAIAKHYTIQTKKQTTNLKTNHKMWDDVVVVCFIRSAPQIRTTSFRTCNVFNLLEFSFPLLAFTCSTTNHTIVKHINTPIWYNCIILMKNLMFNMSYIIMCLSLSSTDKTHNCK